LLEFVAAKKDAAWQAQGMATAAGSVPLKAERHMVTK
jgi:hypothetical protein